MLHWQWKSFPELTLDELYDVLALRSRVFVVEQRSLYLDADGYDRRSVHLLGVEPGAGLRAYLRVLPPGLKFPEASIGRVVIAPEARGQGHARAMTERALTYIDMHHPRVPVRISAQHYLQRFYESLGFHAEGDVYDEDGIPHIEMHRPPR